MSPRRIAHLWLPLFATDRVTRPGRPLAEWRGAPLALVSRAAGGLRVTAANRAAREAGVAPGLPAADAQALCPGLRTAPAEPEADAAALAALAEWCQRWSPLTAPEVKDGMGKDGIWIDTTGCAHLFGGEQAMLFDMLSRLEGLGFVARAGLADTPGAAWALSRFGDGPAAICPEGAARQWLGGFPVAALRLPAAAADTLRRLGVRRIGELMALPRAPLAARFGDGVATRLDQMLGRLPDVISPRPAEEPVSARLAFAEPIGRTEDVAAAIRALLDTAALGLERRGLGARRLLLKVFRVDGTVLAQRLGTNEAVRDPAHLTRLFAETLDGLDAGFGIEVMTLAVTEAEPFVARQGDIERRAAAGALSLLVDRLARRLGPAAVYRRAPRPTHLPERAAMRLPPLAPLAEGWPAKCRPVRMPARPAPVTVELAEDGRPVRVAALDLGAAEGPERIASEWWAGDPPGHRDYWRVETAHGQRSWVFMDRDGRWFRHGIFG